MYLTLGIAAAIAAWQGTMGNVTSGTVIAQLLQMTNYYTIAFGEQHLVPYTGVMWSLSVEEHYYLLYPLALLALLPRFDRRHIGWMLAAGCVLVLIWRCCLIFMLHVSSDYTYISTDARFDSILFGCVMGMALTRRSGKGRSSALHNGQWRWPGAVLCWWLHSCIATKRFGTHCATPCRG